MRTTLSISAKNFLKSNSQTAPDPNCSFRAVFVPFWGGKCDFLQVFVPRALIFKKLHLLLHSKMEVQGEKCVENH